MASIEIITVPAAVYEAEKDKGCTPEMSVFLDHDAHAAFGAAATREESQADWDGMGKSEQAMVRLNLALRGDSGLYDAVAAARAAEKEA